MKYRLALFFLKILVKHDVLLMAFIFKIIDKFSIFLLFCCAVGLNPAHIQCCFRSPFDLKFFLRDLEFAAIIFYHTIKFLCRHIFLFIYYIRMKCYGNVGLSNTAVSMHQSHHEPTESIELADNLFFPFLLTYLI